MADYDAIVVGAGLAGSTAAYCMAKAGMSVLILERGDTAGSKNVSGGRLYAHSLEKIMPGFAKEAPVERLVTKEVITMMTKDSAFSVDFSSTKFKDDPAKASYTVLRAPFDEWLASKAEEAGCDVVCPARVDDFIRKNGKIAGVIAGEDELTADLVILADGVNSLLAQKAGLKKELTPHDVGVGVKEVIELPEDVINARFCLEKGDGMARLFAGSVSDGMMGGGLLYTNKTSLCLGVIVGVKGMMTAKNRLPDMMESFRNHPAIKPMLEGGKLVEYSAHLVPEAGIHMLPTLYADNILVTGDAAGFCINIGYTVRGMDLAIASGEAAAQTAIAAKEKGDYSSETLAGYQTRLEDSFVMQDLKTYSNAPAFIDQTTRLFNEYPQMIEDIFLDMFTMDGKPAKKMIRKMLPIIRQAGIFNLIKDGIKGLGAI